MKKLSFILLFLLWITNIAFSINLKITEVYYDWRNEWIEITNVDNENFGWLLVLSWAKSTNVTVDNVYIKTWNSVVYWDKVEGIINEWVVWKAGLWLSIADTKAIDIDLIYSWAIVDKFQVDIWEVKKYNNKKTSFERLYNWSWMSTQVDNDRISNVSGVIANPWTMFGIEKLYIVEEKDNENDDDFLDEVVASFKDLEWGKWPEIINCDISLTRSRYSDSWKYLMSFNLNNMDSKYCASNIEWKLSNNLIGSWCKIDDIPFWTWIFSLNVGFYSWNNLLCNDAYMILNNFKEKTNYVNVYVPVVEEKIDCEIVQQSAKKHEDGYKVNFEAKVSEKKYCDKDKYDISWNMWSWKNLTWSCNPRTQLFWMWENNVKFQIASGDKQICTDEYAVYVWYEENEETISNLNCWINFQSVDDAFYWPKNINLTAVANGKEIQNSSKTYECQWSIWSGMTVDKCNPSYIDFDTWLQNINLTVSGNDQICTTSQFINLPEYNECVKYKPSATSCLEMNSSWLTDLVNLMLMKYKSDSTFKNIFAKVPAKYVAKAAIQKQITLLKPEKIVCEAQDTQIDVWLMDEKLYKNKLVFTYILPNPTWRDVWKEMVWVKSLDNTIWSLSWFYLWTWKRKIYLSWSVSLNTEKEFVGNYWFLNKWWCVSLVNDKYIYDKICYNWVKEWVKVKWDKKEIVKNNVHVKFTWKNVCVYSNKTKLFCDYIGIYDKIDELKSVAKDFTKYKKTVKKQVAKAEKDLVKHTKKIEKNMMKDISKHQKENKKILKKLVKSNKQVEKAKDDKNKSTKKYKKKLKILNGKLTKSKWKAKKLTFIKNFLSNYIIFLKKHVNKKIRITLYKDYEKKLSLVKKGQKYFAMNWLQIPLQNWNIHGLAKFETLAKNKDILCQNTTSGILESLICKPEENTIIKKFGREMIDTIESTNLIDLFFKNL